MKTDIIFKAGGRRYLESGQDDVAPERGGIADESAGDTTQVHQQRLQHRARIAWCNKN